jgi:hypothetical protein
MSEATLLILGIKGRQLQVRALATSEGQKLATVPRKDARRCSVARMRATLVSSPLRFRFIRLPFYVFDNKPFQSAAFLVRKMEQEKNICIFLFLKVV